MRVWFAVLSALLLVGVSSCGSHSTSGKVSSANRLVDTWKGKPVSPRDTNVVAVQQHLTSLAKKCRESESMLASLIAAALKILGEHGLHGSPVQLTEDLDKLAPSTMVALDCTGLLAAVLTQFDSQVAP